MSGARGVGEVIEGEIVRRGDAAYDTTWSAMLWNGLKPERFPDLIVRVASDRDVRAAVRLARSEGLRVAIRSHGHSWCGSPLRDGGMLIDLSALNACEIDPAARTATVQPALTGREFVAALAPHGLTFPAGHCGPVALSGYLLSGGLGWNSGLHGPAAAGVQAVEVVTADGDALTCSRSENPDLFWAARARPRLLRGRHPLPCDTARPSGGGRPDHVHLSSDRGRKGHPLGRRSSSGASGECRGVLHALDRLP